MGVSATLLPFGQNPQITLSSSKVMEKVLIHTCCAPCFVSVEPYFQEKGMVPVAFFYNPFIHPFKEYKARFKSMKKLEEEGFEVHYRDEYELRDFVRKVLDMEEKGEKRCSHCYEVRLRGTMEKSAEMGISKVATTLIVSPYQDIPLINAVGKELQDECGVEYMPLDLQNYHDEGHRRAREQGYYMQNYCGCIFSEQERFEKPLKNNNG